MMKLLPLFFVLTYGSVLAAELTPYISHKLHQAQQLDSKGRLKQAIEILRPLDNLRRYDEAVIARSLGVYYWRDHQTSAAVKELERALNTKVLSGDELYQVKMMLADLYFNQQQYVPALDLYRALVAQTSAALQGALWLKIAKAHYQSGEWQEVIKAAVKVNPDTRERKVELLALMVASQVELKDWASAEHHLKSLLGYQPDNALWWRQLVGVQLAQSKSMEALASLGVAQQIIDLSSQEEQIYIQLLSQQGNPEKAASRLMEKSTLNKDQKVQQAYLWQQAREWQKAIQVWQHLAETDEQYYLNIAQIHFRQGEYQQAFAALEQIQFIEAEVLLMKVRTLHKLGRNSEALERAREADAQQSTTETQSWLAFLEQVNHLSQ